MAERDPSAAKGSQTNPYAQGETPPRGYLTADDFVEMPDGRVVRPARFMVDGRDPDNVVREHPEEPGVLLIP